MSEAYGNGFIHCIHWKLKVHLPVTVIYSEGDEPGISHLFGTQKTHHSNFFKSISSKFLPQPRQDVLLLIASNTSKTSAIQKGSHLLIIIYVKKTVQFKLGCYGQSSLETSKYQGY
jgi:hypothetical protein